MSEVFAIKDKNTLAAIRHHLTTTGNTRLLGLFNIGVNVGLRISDLIKIQFDEIVEGAVSLTEKKTGKARIIQFNESAIAAVAMLRTANPTHIYLFQAVGNRVGRQIQPVSINYVHKQCKQLQDDLKLPNFGSHSLRKTFGYFSHTEMGVPLSTLMAVFNHASEKETARYIGITADDIKQVYTGLNL